MTNLLTLQTKNNVKKSISSNVYNTGIYPIQINNITERIPTVNSLYYNIYNYSNPMKSNAYESNIIFNYSYYIMCDNIILFVTLTSY